MNIRPVLPSEIDQVRSVLSACGWDHRAADLMRLDELLSRSQVALVAIEDGVGVIGFARALTDGISNGYVSMLAVHKSHRRRGVGSALMHACMGTDLKMTWVLRAGRPGLINFYERLGFKVSSVTMERPRMPEGDASQETHSK